MTNIPALLGTGDTLESNVTVTAKLMLVNPSLPAGVTFYNTSSVSKVWITNNSAGASGSGIPVGPLGSALWTSDREPCYAILDAAASVPALVAYSANLEQPTDPVAIGAAIAAQLLVTGVPQVYLSTLLYFNITMAQGPGGAVLLNTDQYASLSMAISSGSTNACGIKLEWFGDLNGTGTLMDTTQITSVDSSERFTSALIPVIGKSVRLTNISPNPNTLGITVYGTNRTQPSLKLQDCNTPFRTFLFTGAVTNGTPVVLAPNDGDIKTTTFNGPVDIQFAVSGAGAIGTLQIVSAIPATMVKQALTKISGIAAGASVEQVTAHPLGRCSWQVLPGATVAAATYSMTLIGEPNF